MKTPYCTNCGNASDGAFCSRCGGKTKLGTDSQDVCSTAQQTAFDELEAAKKKLAEAKRN